MDKAKKYATAAAFRRALEDRLKNLAKAGGIDLQRVLREAAFDRFLVRLFADQKAPWVLKGGYALELRMKEARATRDIDLALKQSLGKAGGKSLNDAIRDALTDAAAYDAGDFFSFVIGEPMQDLDGAPYGGARFPIETMLDGRTFVKFHIDVGAGDVVLTPLETTMGHDWFDFAGISAGKFPTISREQHFAEKIHAYTLPRENPNSRTRDLIDMVLLIQRGALNQKKTIAAIEATFKRRDSHSIPTKLKSPPESWRSPFAAMAQSCGLSTEMDGAFAVVESFYSELGFE